MFLHCLCVCIFLNEESVVVLIFVPLFMSVFPLHLFFSILFYSFAQFNFNVTWYSFLCVTGTLLLSYLRLQISGFLQIWKSLGHYVFKYSFCLCLLETPCIQGVGLLKLSHSPLMTWLLFSPYFTPPTPHSLSPSFSMFYF